MTVKNVIIVVGDTDLRQVKARGDALTKLSLKMELDPGDEAVFINRAWTRIRAVECMSKDAKIYTGDVNRLIMYEADEHLTGPKKVTRFKKILKHLILRVRHVRDEKLLKEMLDYTNLREEWLLSAAKRAKTAVAKLRKKKKKKKKK